MWRKHIAKDGSCLFRAVAEQVGNCVFHLSVFKNPVGVPVPGRSLTGAQ